LHVVHLAPAALLGGAALLREARGAR
jgi:hypothetical protein